MKQESSTSTAQQMPLHRHHDTSVLVPGQERVLAVPRLRVFDVRPATHEVFVAHDLGQFASDGAVEVLDDVEIRGEEDIEVALLDLVIG